jgi:hypothetical protein
MHNLIETIARELERPREITTQVVRHLDGTFGVERDDIGSFLKDKFPGLEDFEHDLILSPLFTPRLLDQAIFADALGSESIPRPEWPKLVAQLADRPTTAHLMTTDGKTHQVPLRGVVIERYVNRLRLDGAIAPSLLEIINRSPAQDRSMLKAIARRAIWESGNREEILEKYLSTSLSKNTYSIADAVRLLGWIEDYQPADVNAVAARIPRWQKALEDDLATAQNPKPFFNSSIQQMHGGDDHRQRDEARIVTKREQLEFLQRLQKEL